MEYKSADIIHDAAISLLTSKGIPAGRLIGQEAAVWSCGPAFARKKANSYVYSAREVVFSTADPEVAKVLVALTPEDLFSMKSRRSRSDEKVDFAGWAITPDLAPIVPGIQSLECLMASPFLIKNKDRSSHTWHRDVREFDVNAAVSRSLSRLSRKEVHLTLLPDTSYIESRNKHSTCITLKAEKVGSSVFGLLFPFLLVGKEEDLALAWYAGIGAKTRMGFGIVAAV